MAGRGQDERRFLNVSFHWLFIETQTLTRSERLLGMNQLTLLAKWLTTTLDLTYLSDRLRQASHPRPKEPPGLGCFQKPTKRSVQDTTHATCR